MAIIVGRVPDLNFEPFYIDMERRGIILQDAKLNDVPQALRDGAINAGPVSLVDSFDLEDVCLPVAGFCLAASNRAGSNLLYSKKPMAELSGADVAVATPDSTTRKFKRRFLSGRPLASKSFDETIRIWSTENWSTAATLQESNTEFADLWRTVSSWTQP